MADRDDRTALIATVGAGFIVGTHVAGLATRNATWVEVFGAENMPWMTIATAVVTIIAVLASMRAMSRMGPGRFVPALFFVSALIFVCEALANNNPKLEQFVAISVFLHTTTISGTLVSGFWALISERFDPRTARKKMSGMTVGAAAGTLVTGGGLWLVGDEVKLHTILWVFAGSHFVAGLIVGRLRSPTPAHQGTDDVGTSGLAALRRTPYLRDLALVILLGSVAIGVLDYLFNIRVEAAYDEERLRSVYAAYYTVVGVATFGVQTTLGRRLLQRAGPGGSLAVLPATMAAGALAIFNFGTGHWPTTLSRGGTAAVRTSLFQSAFELLFNPVPARDRRATKTFIDVGCDGVGDALGGVLCLAVAEWGLGAAVMGDNSDHRLLFITFGLCALLLVIVVRLRRGYIAELEKSLRSRAADLALATDTMADVSTRTVIMATMGGMPGVSLMTSGIQFAPEAERGPDERDAENEKASASTAEKGDALAERIHVLRFGGPVEIRAALQLGRITAPLVPHVVALLGRSETAGPATQALSPVAARHCGQLVDALLDPDMPSEARQRLPRVIAAARNRRAVDGLLEALSDDSFDVRYRTARALSTLVDKDPHLQPDTERVFELVSAEVSVTEEVWRGRDDSARSGSHPGLTRRSLEHLFRLLGLVLPGEPLRVAFRGLTSDDQHMRGTALEYLEGALPTQVRAKLWPLLED